VKNSHHFHGREFLFLSYLESNYSRSSVYLNSKVIQNRNPEFQQVNSGFWSSYLHILRERKNISQFSNIVVMSPSHSLVLLIVILTGRRPILDAGWSLTESTLIRSSGFRSFVKVPKSYLIDLFAFHLSRKVFLESNEQVDFVARTFGVSKKKLSRIFTGVNEKVFGSFSSNLKSRDSLRAVDNRKFTVLFRGKNNQEAGLDCILGAAEILKYDEVQFVIATDFISKETCIPVNVQIITNRLSEMEMVELYSISDLCLGQISSNPRLKRTIPHKAFEALFFSKCYLTLPSKPILEVLPSASDRASLKNPKPTELASEIRRLSGVSTEVKEIGRLGNLRYGKVASQEVLGLRFLEQCS
jgi:hypothetical protein